MAAPKTAKKKPARKSATTAKKNTTKKAAPAATPTRKQLVSLAKEMNKQMKLEPVIGFSGKVSDEDLVKGINKNAKDILADDEFSEASHSTLSDLGIKHKSKGGKKAAAEKAVRPAAQKKKPTKKSSREEAVVKSLPKKYTTLSDWAEAANDLYVKNCNGDKTRDNIPQSEHVIKVSLRALIPAEFVEIKDEGGVKKYRRKA